MGRKGKKKRDEKIATLEQGVVAIAEQLGYFLGTVRSRADGLLENEAVAKQVSTIRDGAFQLLARVGKAGMQAQESVMTAVEPALKAAKSGAEKAAQSVAPKASKSSKTKVTMPAAKPAATKTARSGGTVDAPGKKHRKAPPKASSIDKRFGEATGKKAGQKQFKVGKSRGRG
jgi:septum formation inhibitor MinC